MQIDFSNKPTEKYKIRVFPTVTNITLEDINTIWFLTFSSRNMYTDKHIFNTDGLRLLTVLYLALFSNISEGPS